MRRLARAALALGFAVVGALVVGCDYVRLLRPKVLEQLNPRVVRLDQPGLYSFGCPASNHAGRGMLGLAIVKGDVPAEARLDRPRMPRPESR